MSTMIKTEVKRSKVAEFVKDICVAFCASFVIAASGPISVTFPFSVVPFVLQLQVVLLVGYLLGMKRGSLAVGFFLMQGLMGYPVFSGVNNGIGIGRFLGPTGGYLIGYFMSALVMGSLKAGSELKTFAILAAGNLTVYFFGAIWLSGFIGFQNAILFGIFPFIFPDFLKLVVATKLAKSARKSPVLQ